MSLITKANYENYRKLVSEVFNTVYDRWTEDGYRIYIYCLTEHCIGLPSHLYKETFVKLEITNEAVGSFEQDTDTITIEIRFSNVPAIICIDKLAIMQIGSEVAGKPILMVPLPAAFIVQDKDLADYRMEQYKKFNKSTVKDPVDKIESQRPKVSHLRRIK